MQLRHIGIKAQPDAALWLLPTHLRPGYLELIIGKEGVEETLTLFSR